MKYRDYITLYDNGCGNVKYYYKGRVVTDTIKIFQNILDAEFEKDGFDICPDDIRLQILEKYINDKKVLKARWQKLKEWVDDDNTGFSHEYPDQSSDWVINQYEILKKMEELEQEKADE